MSSVTYVEVETAINELLKIKKALTLANIRQQLGDRGSMTTLSKYLQQWKNSKFLDRIPTQTIAEPAPDQIMSAVQTVWHQMIGHGQEQLGKLQEEFSTQEAQWVVQENELQIHIQELTEALQKERDAHTFLKEESHHLEKNYQQLQQDNARLDEALKKEQHYLKECQQQFQEMKVVLEQNYTIRFQELLKIVDETKKVARSEVDNLKVLLEQQRHEHLVALDRLTVEHRQLLILHQQQKTQEELTQAWGAMTQELKGQMNFLTENQNQVLQSAQHVYQNFIEQQQRFLKMQHHINFYQKQRIRFS
jgi:chromosome segregation ATPase